MQGPNVKRLILEKTAVDAVPDNGGIAEAVSFISSKDRILSGVRAATAWVEKAILLVRNCPGENPWADKDDEAIAGELLREIDKRRKARSMTEFISAMEFARSIVSKPNPSIPLGDLARQFLKLQADKTALTSTLNDEINRNREEPTVPALLAAIRKHRDYRGDDRCHLDDGELYSVLPEGDTRPERDTAVTIENCQRFIECRQQGREYVSPEREFEKLHKMYLNQKSIIAKQEEAITLVRWLMLKPMDQTTPNKVAAIFDAASRFNPLFPEEWPGWPEGVA